MSSYWIKFLEFMVRYIPSIVGVIAQILFLWLKVDLRSWKDDLLNVLVYIAFQMFLACIIFLGVPEALDLYRLDYKIAIYLILLVGLLSLFKMLRVIPLESSKFVKTLPEDSSMISFHDLFDELHNSGDLEIKKGYVESEGGNETLKRKLKIPQHI